MNIPSKSIFISLPFNFASKDDALLIKKNVKKCFAKHTFLFEPESTIKNYIDQGPSFLEDRYMSTYRFENSKKILQPCFKIRPNTAKTCNNIKN